MTENLIRVKNIISPSLRDFIESFCILGYVVVANVFTWYVLPEMLFLTNPYIIGLSVLFPIGGLLLGGLKGFAKGALIFPAGIALINAAFFPFYFLWWLAGLLFAFLKSQPFPIAINVANFLVLSFLTLYLLFLAFICILDIRNRKDEGVSGDYDDYSSPTFTMDIWGGRWG
jgi:hypothetical protein